ncbi:MAG: cache domain-containing protein, partial [Holophagae bacterium]|nr:cache domain-containing protein [Holophagae bacterium]
MKKVQSIRSVFFRYVLWLIVVSVVLSGLLKVGMEWQRSRVEFRKIRETHVNHQKELLKERVEMIFYFVQYRRSYMEKKICKLGTVWANEAEIFIALAIQTSPAGTSLRTRQNYAIDILKKLNPPSGFGITAIDTEKNKTIFSSMSSALTEEQTHTILSHASNSPFEADGLIGHAFVIPAVHLCIAVLKPRVQQEEWLKSQVLNYAASIRFGKEGYIFINTFDGIPLLRDGKPVKNGKSMWELTDPNGVKVIQKEYEAATKNDGDFIYYSWRKLTHDRVMPKVSYIRGMKDWQWIVGTGVYMDEMETV